MEEKKQSKEKVKGRGVVPRGFFVPMGPSILITPRGAKVFRPTGEVVHHSGDGEKKESR